jgi:hypothetical protein
LFGGVAMSAPNSGNPTMQSSNSAAFSLPLLAFLLCALVNAPADDEPGEAKPQRILVKDSRKEKTVDAYNWGEDIANPFAALTEEGKAKLKKRGVDVDKLIDMDARLITGHYTGAATIDFANEHPDIILVFGKDFLTHGSVKSAGPILAVEDAEFMGEEHEGKSLVWFAERSRLRADKSRGSPLILSNMDGEDGWKRPSNLFELPKTERKAASSFIPEREKKRAVLMDRIKSQEGVPTKDETKDIVNPFTDITVDGKTKLKRRGIDVERLTKLSARLLTGKYFGADSKTFVNVDPDTVLVIGPDFETHGDIYSAGPILSRGDAHFMGKVVGADLVWFVDSSFPRGEVAGLPVILAPSACWSQIRPGTEHIWRGEYGWRSPRGLK